MVGVAVLQAEMRTRDSVATRVRRMTDRVRELPSNVDMAVLPELWTVGAFAVRHFPDVAEPLEGSTTTHMRALAAERHIWLHAGSIVERDGDDLFNTAVLIDPRGAIAATYRKIHLFGFTGGESRIITAGDRTVMVETPLGRTGLATCYDLRFPEQFRSLREQGAEALLIPTGWPAARIDHWRVLAIARAIENQATVVGANAAGVSGRTELGGRSLIVSSAGRVLAETPSLGDATAITDIDPQDTRLLRGRFPVHDDRVDLPDR